ncbi:RIP metalloprotease RseP [Pusillimonas sp. TS35]|uniref:RIP metalloprotease RseP n=1 Tax=Paracandidimonas lactea TaxID=2895524 RepID=UPI00136873BC|nr:RIP metalloprotease RseP [Paracandidimonas lactea]MYN12193.1 RIP metalloprotease RseP [Pusillimonas sp. TS35]
MLYTLVAFVVALGVLITFHELGHYWVARRCGVRVLRFSVGFGKVIARRTDRHGTEWALSAIPLGGYVKMLDEAATDAAPGASQEAFNSKSLAQRSAIVAAGPAANLLLAAILYTMLNLAGTSEPAAILGKPAASTPAAQAGLMEGDRIESVNDQPVRSWSEARWQLLDVTTSGGTAVLRVDHGGLMRDRTIQFPPSNVAPDAPDPLRQAGLVLAAPRPMVGEVLAGGAGEAAGLRQGDIIVAAGSLQRPSAAALVAEIQKHPGQPLALTVLRGGTPVTATVTPTPEAGSGGAQVGRIGVLLTADFPMVTVRYGLFDSIARGVSRTGETVWYSLKMMGRMVIGDVSLRNVSGPVTIADYAGQTARIGLAAYIGFLALISVSIGVLNLLPIPMLDGGHLLYYAIEAIRGKPLSEKWLENGQRVGLGLLAVLMSIAFFNDFVRLFS